MLGCIDIYHQMKLGASTVKMGPVILLYARVELSSKNNVSVSSQPESETVYDVKFFFGGGCGS